MGLKESNQTNKQIMQVKSIAEGEHSAILLTFVKLPFVIKIFILSIFEWPFYTGFTVIGSNFFFTVLLTKQCLFTAT